MGVPHRSLTLRGWTTVRDAIAVALQTALERENKGGALVPKATCRTVFELGLSANPKTDFRLHARTRRIEKTPHLERSIHGAGWSGAFGFLASNRGDFDTFLIKGRSLITPGVNYALKIGLSVALVRLTHPARWRRCQWRMTLILNYASPAFVLPTCRRRECRRSDGNVRIVTPPFG